MLTRTGKTEGRSASNGATERAAEVGDEGQSATLTKSVYEQIRTEVLTGKLRPGEKLGAENLRKRFNTGSTPVREALNRLLAEGFVALEEQKGFRVAPVSREELAELVKARCWIDGAAITESIQRFETSWEESLILALHRLTRTARSPHGDANAEWEALHKAFHRALVGGCGSRWITRISEQLFDAAERYRLLAAEQVSERNELDEHRGIVDACLDRDVQKAVRLLEQHYGRTFEVISNAPDIR